MPSNLIYAILMTAACIRGKTVFEKHKKFRDPKRILNGIREKSSEN
jgi:hypothetical protein